MMNLLILLDLTPIFEQIRLKFCPRYRPLNIVEVSRGKNSMPSTPRRRAWHSLFWMDAPKQHNKFVGNNSYLVKLCVSKLWMHPKAHFSKRFVEPWKVAQKTLRWNVLFFFDAHAVLFCFSPFEWLPLWKVRLNRHALKSMAVALRAIQGF